MTKTVILGASGYIGSRLKRDLAENGHAIIGSYSTNNITNDLVKIDITKRDEVLNFIEKEKPDIIIHSANNHSSKWCEQNKDKAYTLNTVATNFIVEAANTFKSKLIYISTMGAINAENFYQRTKKESEDIILKNAKTNFLILRPSIGFGLSPNTSTENFYNSALDLFKKNKIIEADVSLKVQPTYLGHISTIINSAINLSLWNKTIPISVSTEKSKYHILTDTFGKLGANITQIDLKRLPFNSVKNIDEVLRGYKLPTMNYAQFVQLCLNELNGLTQ